MAAPDYGKRTREYIADTAIAELVAGLKDASKEFDWLLYNALPQVGRSTLRVKEAAARARTLIEKYGMDHPTSDPVGFGDISDA